jgi:nicotinamide-nucleotide amidase
MRAIIIAVGDELISGASLDTNSQYLARQLAGQGIVTESHWVVGDDETAVADAVTRAGAAADVVIVTGGLGPTADDLTRQALAKALGSELVLDDRCLATIENFFYSRARKMQPSNRIQAMIPAGAEPMENATGTAPGIAARIGSARVFVLPGVPHEMKTMFEAQVVHRLPRREQFIAGRTIHTFGAGESEVASVIADLMRRDANPSVGTTVDAGLVSVRIGSRAKTSQDAQRQVEDTSMEIKRRLGKLVIGENDATMASVVGGLLRARKERLATAESCTGGLIGQLVTSVPGSSDYYLGGIVGYANQAKVDLLGVDEELIADHGAVSEKAAAAMAEGCRARFRSDWAVSTTGIAGPGGGTESKPAGLVYVGLSGPPGSEVYRYVFPGDRATVRLRTALAALNHLRLSLLG